MALNLLEVAPRYPDQYMRRVNGLLRRALNTLVQYILGRENHAFHSYYRCQPRAWLRICATIRGGRLARVCHLPGPCFRFGTQSPGRCIGGAVQVLALDVSDLATVKAAAEKLDGEAIDLLLNSAGVNGASGQKVGSVDYDSWTQVFDVNTMGPMRVSEAFSDHVARSDRKLIVTITSGMGSLAGNTSGGSIAYRSSKAAVNMVMRSLAIETAGRGISCILVHPGWVRTDMGGPNATLAPAESVTALRRLIERLGPDQSGKFFDYDGSEYPW